MAIKHSIKKRVAGGFLLLVALAVLGWFWVDTGALAALTDRGALRDWVEQLGHWGPIGIIAIMIAAIVLSPIPSGPVAMVAGAAYGGFWGTVVVVIGAEAGALIAFTIARSFGYEVIYRWRRVRPALDWLGKKRSQRTLMLIIFASRLMPFISFDAVSYAAGLTPLSFWRFALATLVGVIPTAYLFTSFGGVLITGNSDTVMIVLILASSVTLLSFMGRLLWTERRRRQNSNV